MSEFLEDTPKMVTSKWGTLSIYTFENNTIISLAPQDEAGDIDFSIEGFGEDIFYAAPEDIDKVIEIVELFLEKANKDEIKPVNTFALISELEQSVKLSGGDVERIKSENTNQAEG